VNGQPRELRIYTTEDGDAPFSNWLNRLRDAQGRAIVRTRLARIRLGNFGDCKAVGDGVFEFRIDFGPGYRVYFGQEGNRLVILLCGGDKRTQSKDIAKAKKFWSDYRSRDDAKK
jgi:putative addiction module killer protein